jgi:hypothetical protein
LADGEVMKIYVKRICLGGIAHPAIDEGLSEAIERWLKKEDAEGQVETFRKITGVSEFAKFNESQICLAAGPGLLKLVERGEVKELRNIHEFPAQCLSAKADRAVTVITGVISREAVSVYLHGEGYCIQVH